MYPMSHIEGRGEISSSRERIVEEGTVSHVGTGRSSEEFGRRKNGDGAIVKTVEFEFHSSAA